MDLFFAFIEQPVQKKENFEFKLLANTAYGWIRLITPYDLDRSES